MYLATAKNLILFDYKRLFFFFFWLMEFVSIFPFSHFSFPIGRGFFFASRLVS